MVRKPVLFLLLLGGCVSSLLLGEMWARSTMPHSNRTPYRTAPVDGLPSILGANIELVWQGAAVKTNSLGFRGPEPTPEAERSPDIPRVAIVGDSFVFGSGVDWEDTLGVRFQKAMRAAGQDVEVLNCGVPGYNIANTAVNLAEFVMPLKPDLVVFLAFANDTDPHQDYGEIQPDRKPDPVSPFLLRSALIQRKIIVLRDFAAHFDVHLGRNSLELQRDTYAGEGGERIRAGLNSMKATCDSAGVPLVVAIYPFMVRPERNPYMPIEQGVARDAEALGLQVVRLERAFAGFERREHWAHPIYDSHPDGEANELAGAFLASKIIAR